MHFLCDSTSILKGRSIPPPLLGLPGQGKKEKGHQRRAALSLIHKKSFKCHNTPEIRRRRDAKQPAEHDRRLVNLAKWRRHRGRRLVGVRGAGYIKERLACCSTHRTQPLVDQGQYRTALSPAAAAACVTTSSTATCSTPFTTTMKMPRSFSPALVLLATLIAVAASQGFYSQRYGKRGSDTRQVTEIWLLRQPVRQVPGNSRD
ncbi:hypothetical protein O3P69_003149 [Scylla paramamosain]|uniref:Uncharacterized protein n=1 Tax=Scylla paramamosain TaxID=85552 RepID=A0AAW0UJB5_SCYPA